MPLLVIAHGDHETADVAAGRWRAVALKRGWAVLAIQCPPKLKQCEMGQWYMWNPKPSWIEAQVATVEQQISIDPKRIYLAGWSGGATYVGMHSHQWTKFAALVFHGGGRKPTADSCPDGVGAYFLMSKNNYFFKWTEMLHQYWKHCKATIEWDLNDVRNHEAEEALLTEEKAATILDWLGKRVLDKKIADKRKR